MNEIICKLNSKRNIILPWCLVLCITVVLLSWSASSPAGSSPDDDYHLSSSYCGQGLREELCESSPFTGENLVPSGILKIDECYTPMSVSAGCQIQYLDDSSGQLESTSRLNNQGFYPAQFYRIASIMATTDISASAFRMRIINILFVLAALCTTYYASHKSLRRVMPLAFSVASMPLGLFFFSSNNPSSWAVIGTSCLGCTLLNLFDEGWKDRRLRLSVSICISLYLSLGSRPDSAWFVIIYCVSTFIWIYKSLSFRSRLSVPLLIIFLGIISRLISSEKSSNLLSKGFLSVNTILPGKDVFLFNFSAIPRLLFGAFGYSSWEGETKLGHLGWFNTPVPPLSTFLVLAVFIYLCTRDISTWPLNKKNSIVFLWFVFASIPLFILQMDRVLIPQNIQPRYLLSFLFVILVYSLTNFDRSEMKFSKSSVVGIVVALSLAHLLCLHQFIRRYAQGYGGFGWSLSSGAQWWEYSPLSPTITWLFGSFCFTVFLVLSAIHLSTDFFDENTKSLGR